MEPIRVPTVARAAGVGLNFLTMRLILPLLLLGTALAVRAQQPTLVFDPIEGTFSDRAQLPAETPFNVQGDLPDGVERVRLDLRDAGQGLGELLFGGGGLTAEWSRPPGVDAGYWRIRVPHALHGGRHHDVVLTLFRPATGAERIDLGRRLESTLGELLDLRLSEGNKARWEGGTARLLADAESLVRDATADVAYRRALPFAGFSDLVRETAADAEGHGEGLRAEALRRVRDVMLREVAHLHGEGLLVVAHQYVLRDYPVARTRTELHLQAGYQGVYFGGGFSAFDYDGAPFAGLSFPLGNPALRSAFWANSAFDVGVLLTNLEDGDGRTLSGPVVGRPFYAGLSYRLVSFLRLNAGATVLEAGGGSGIFDVGTVELRPYLGLSGAFRFWADLDQR